MKRSNGMKRSRGMKKLDRVSGGIAVGGAANVGGSLVDNSTSDSMKDNTVKHTDTIVNDNESDIEKTSISQKSWGMRLDLPVF